MAEKIPNLKGPCPTVRKKQHCYGFMILQQDEVTDEMMTFHEKVNHMQELEEEIIDDQKSLIDVCTDQSPSLTYVLIRVPH